MEPYKEALEGKTSPNQNTEAACQRLIGIFLRREEIMEKLDQPWNNEIQFNWVVATEILQPLSGGVCIINKKPLGLSRDNDHFKNIVTPKDIKKDGLLIGKKILLLLSSKLRGVTNQTSCQTSIT